MFEIDVRRHTYNVLSAMLHIFRQKYIYIFSRYQDGFVFVKCHSKTVELFLIFFQFSGGNLNTMHMYRNSRKRYTFYAFDLINLDLSHIISYYTLDLSVFFKISKRKIHFEFQLHEKWPNARLGFFKFLWRNIGNIHSFNIRIVYILCESDYSNC